MTCLDERRLLEVHFDDASPATRAHVAACVDCTARLRLLRRDLGRVDTVLRAVPPRMRPRPVAVLPLARGLAAAAMLALAIAVHRQTDVRAPNTDDTLALADELASSMNASVFLDDESFDRPATTRSTCTWGDPLLGVGCDEPGVMRTAWR